MAFAPNPASNSIMSLASVTVRLSLSTISQARFNLACSKLSTLGHLVILSCIVGERPMSSSVIDLLLESGEGFCSLCLQPPNAVLLQRCGDQHLIGLPRRLAFLFLGGVQVDADWTLLLSCSSFSPSSLPASLLPLFWLHCPSSLSALSLLLGAIGSLKVACTPPRT